MSDLTTTLSALETAIRDEEQRLILQRSEIRAFTVVAHTAKDNFRKQLSVNMSEAAIGDILKGLNELQPAAQEFRSEVRGLCSDVRSLYIHVNDMNAVLAYDLQRLNRDEDKIVKPDIIRNAGIMAGIMGLFIAAYKAGIGNETWSIQEATVAGGVVGGVTLGYKSVGKVFVAAGKIVTNQAVNLRDGSTLVVWQISDTMQAKKTATLAIFRNQSEFIGKQVSKIKARRYDARMGRDKKKKLKL